MMSTDAWWASAKTWGKIALLFTASNYAGTIDAYHGSINVILKALKLFAYILPTASKPTFADMTIILPYISMAAWIFPLQYVITLLLAYANFLAVFFIYKKLVTWTSLIIR